MTTGVWVILLSCAACCSLFVALWWMDRKNKWEVSLQRRLHNWWVGRDDMGGRYP